tara:strand:+ start:154 stop:381 length:228 start_codon:yes stop_codon:yes gene_type:complete
MTKINRMTKKVKAEIDEIISEGLDVFLARWENQYPDTNGETQAKKKLDRMEKVADLIRERLKIPDFDPAEMGWTE